jgi:putative redox protein
MTTQKLSFKNKKGEALVGRLDQPEGRGTFPIALFAHCFTCTKNLKAIAYVSRALTDEGYAVFRFDFTGLGESAGVFADTNFTSNTEDLISAASFMESTLGSPRILIGHSLGGAAVLQAAASIDSARAIVTIAAPSEPSHVKKLLQIDASTFENTDAVDILIGGASFKITKQFVDDLDETLMTDRIHKLGRALLVLHSPFDRIVGIDNAAHIFQAAQHPKSFISLDEADHLLSNEADARYVATIIGVWARRYL